MRPKLCFPSRALLSGALHLAGALLFFAWIDPATLSWFTDPVTAPLAIATALGVFWVGTTVGALYYEFGLVVPAVLVASLFVLTAVLAAASIRSPLASASPTFFHLYLGYWPVVLGLVLLVGGGEHLLRGRSIRLLELTSK